MECTGGGERLSCVDGQRRARWRGDARPLETGVETIRDFHATQSSPTVTIELGRKERRVYDRLRASVVAQRAPSEASGLGDLLFLLPDLTVLLMRLLRDGRVPLASKLLALAGIGYVLSPLDFMPAILMGPLGLVDDLVIVAATLSGLLNKVHPDVVRSHWSGQGDALEAIHSVTEWTARQVSDTFDNLVGRVLGR